MTTKTTSEIARGWGWIFFALTALICLLAAFIFDAPVNDWIAMHSSRALRQIMLWVSKLGDWPAHVALGLVLLFAAWLRGNRSWQRVFLAMLIACALAGVSARVLKVAVGRARPSVNTQADSGATRFTAKYQSFPSGHTASSTAFFATLFLLRRKIGAPFLVVPAIIGASRMIVAAHYLSDVVFAAVLGVVCAIVIVRFQSE